MDHGILLAHELQLTQIIVESDSLNAIQAINEGAMGSNMVHIIQGIIQVSVSFKSCLFKHINRSFNSMAHELAQHARRSGFQRL